MVLADSQYELRTESLRADAGEVHCGYAECAEVLAVLASVCGRPVDPSAQYCVIVPELDRP